MKKIIIPCLILFGYIPLFGQTSEEKMTLLLKNELEKEIINWDSAAYAIEQGANVNVSLDIYDLGYKPIHLAVIEGNLEITKKLLDKGADIHETDIDMKAPIHYATSNDNAAMIELLMNHGADINSVDANGYAPIHYAVLSGDFYLVETILNFDADVNQPTLMLISTDEDGPTALDLAFQLAEDSLGFNHGILDLLLSNGAQMETTEKTAVQIFTSYLCPLQSYCHHEFSHLTDTVLAYTYYSMDLNTLVDIEVTDTYSNIDWGSFSEMNVEHEENTENKILRINFTGSCYLNEESLKPCQIPLYTSETEVEVLKRAILEFAFQMK